MTTTDDVESLPSSMPSPTISASSLPPTKTKKRDTYFYFHSVIFEVENTLFNVPRYGLPAEANAFDAMFSREPGAPGSSDDDPIRLDADVTASDFRSLLKATYPSPASPAPLALDEWMGVLKLANKWDLTTLRDKAVKESNALVKNKNPVEKILLARQYGVSKWLNDAYIDLATRKETMGVSDIQQVGWETFGRLMIVRERAAKAGAAAHLAPDVRVKCTTCKSAYESEEPICAICIGPRWSPPGRIDKMPRSTIIAVVEGVESAPFDFAAAIRDVFGDEVA